MMESGPLVDWVEEQMQADLARKVRRFNEIEGAERHLFLSMHDSGMPFDLYYPLAFSASVPDRAPVLPMGLTGLWMMPNWEASVLWWHRERGCTRFEYSEVPGSGRDDQPAQKEVEGDSDACGLCRSSPEPCGFLPRIRRSSGTRSAPEPGAIALTCRGASHLAADRPGRWNDPRAAPTLVLLVVPLARRRCDGLVGATPVRRHLADLTLEFVMGHDHEPSTMGHPCNHRRVPLGCRSGVVLSGGVCCSRGRKGSGDLRHPGSCLDQRSRWRRSRSSGRTRTPGGGVRPGNLGLARAEDQRVSIIPAASASERDLTQSALAPFWPWQ